MGRMRERVNTRSGCDKEALRRWNWSIMQRSCEELALEALRRDSGMPICEKDGKSVCCGVRCQKERQ